MAQSRTENAAAAGQRGMRRLGITDLGLQRPHLPYVRRTTSFSEDHGHLDSSSVYPSSNSAQIPKPPVRTAIHEEIEKMMAPCDAHVWNGGIQDRVTLLSEMHEALQECFTRPQKLSKDCFNSKMIDGLSTYADYLVGEVEETGLAKFDYNKMSTLIEGASRIYGCRVEAVYDLTRQTITTIACGQKENRTNATDEVAFPLQRRTVNDVKLNETATLMAEEKISIPEIVEENRTLDPHFLKVSSLVDEAGVGGLLLTNLTLDASMNLIFDGSSLAFPSANSSSFAALSVDSFSDGLLNMAAVKELFQEDVTMGEMLEICPELRCFEESYQRKSADLPLDSDFHSAQLQENTSFMERQAILPSSGDEGFIPSDLEPPPFLESDFPPPSDFPSLEMPTDLSHSEDNEFHSNLLDSSMSMIHMNMGGMKSDIGGGLNPLKALPKRSIMNGTIKEKNKVSKISKKNSFFDITCVDVSNLLKPAVGFEQMRCNQRRRRRKKTYGFLVADDETTVIFPSKNHSLFTLNSHPGKMIQLSRTCSPSSMIENDLKGTLFDPERKIEGMMMAIVDVNESLPHQSALEGLAAYYPLQTLTEIPLSFETPNHLEVLQNDSFDPSWIPSPPTFSSQFPQPRGTAASFATLYSSLPETLVNRFAKGNRYVDVSKLKKTISNIVKPIEENPPAESTQIMTLQNQPTDFQHVVDRTMEFMPPVDREHCSVHMLFVCLLYVCNDQALLLQPFNEGSGFAIVTDASLEEHLKDDQPPSSTLL
ncbi:hypothetical protein IE077_003420 [Cardiosporidium cionae]|uniref:Condensin complex subunit 2 n=1 Tax=Cardiosporidium cionae TaxID=476202 RepID=A0ABQ7J8B8_9APIC|nr:hypothetical protein IE077_003420 [Cardiosporidium cionae]|eukprot:KAF8820215.1 hypothetical protein IE077_003420 [Cardiosporidium cionae]